MTNRSSKLKKTNRSFTFNNIVYLCHGRSYIFSYNAKVTSVLTLSIQQTLKNNVQKKMNKNRLLLIYPKYVTREDEYLLYAKKIFSPGFIIHSRGSWRFVLYQVFWWLEGGGETSNYYIAPDLIISVEHHNCSGRHSLNSLLSPAA